MLNAVSSLKCNFLQSFHYNPLLSMFLSVCAFHICKGCCLSTACCGYLTAVDQMMPFCLFLGPLLHIFFFFTSFCCPNS
jgi:hypothetical protein